MGFTPLLSCLPAAVDRLVSIEDLNANDCRLRLSFRVISYKCRLWATASKRFKRTDERSVSDIPDRIANENDSH